MLIILNESYSNVINSVADKIIGRALPSTVKYVYKRGMTEAEIQPFLTKPLLASSWLIVIRNASFRKDIVQRLAKSNVVIWHVCSNADFKRVLIQFDDSANIKVINNLNIEKKEVVKWIQGELGCAQDMATAIYNRADGYLDYIVDSVSMFEKLVDDTESITRSDINKYMSKVSKIKMYHLFDHIFLKGNTHKVSELCDYLSGYRNKWDSIKKYLLEEASTYIQIYQYEMSGDLNFTNVKSFIAGHKDLNIPEWKIVKILKEHERISLQSLVSRKAFIEDIDDGPLGICILADTIYNNLWNL